MWHIIIYSIVKYNAVPSRDEESNEKSLSEFTASHEK